MIKVINLLISFALADSRESCTDVDLRNHLPKIRDQGKSSACYAFAAADILSFYSQKNLSAFDLLVSHNQYKSDFKSHYEKIKSGGWGAYSLIQGLNNGVCLESETSSQALGRELLDLIYKLERFAFLSEYEKESASCDSLYFFNNLNKNVIEFYLNTLSSVEVVEKLISANCKKRVFLSNTYKVNQVFAKKDAPLNIKKEIDKRLDFSEPVMINYDPNDLLSGDKIETSHFSLIVGRRFNKLKNRCEYLIRNSWGENKSGYNPEYEVEAGHQWVDVKFINKNVVEATYLSKW